MPKNFCIPQIIYLPFKDTLRVKGGPPFQIPLPVRDKSGGGSGKIRTFLYNVKSFAFIISNLNGVVAIAIYTLFLYVNTV